MPPSWLTDLSWAAIALAGLSALWIAADQWGRGHRQQMGIMEVVWPVTALYLGPVAIWGYRRFGWPKSRRWRAEHGLDEPPAQPGWASVATGVSHCGAGCTLGDICAEWAVFALGASITGLSLLPEYIGDYILALGFGIAFQYFAIAPMRGLGPRKGLIEAAKADVLSLTSFEVGLFGWMALMQFVFFPHHIHPDHAAYWFLMQIGMIVGYFTAWPANVWLIRNGIKESMKTLGPKRRIPVIRTTDGVERAPRPVRSPVAAARPCAAQMIWTPGPGLGRRSRAWLSTVVFTHPSHLPAELIG